MKKFFIVCFAMCLVFMSNVAANDRGNTVFGGIKYTNSAAGLKTIGMSAGYGFKVASIGVGDVWNFSSVEINARQLGSLSPDFAVVFRAMGDSTKSSLFVGLVAAPNVDYLATPESSSYIAYFNGAGGVIVFYKLKNDFGFYLTGKYKFALKDDVLFQDGFQSSIGIFKNF